MFTKDGKKKNVPKVVADSPIKPQITHMEIFKNDQYVLDKTVTLPAIIDRMRELYFILESEYRQTPPIEENIYWIALLGSVSRLFTTLDDCEVFSNLLNKEFKKGARNIIYHCRGPFAEFTGPQLKTFFSHCYEHCVIELSSVLGNHFQPLTIRPTLKDRDESYFNEIISYGLNYKKTGIRNSEIKGLAKDRLVENKKRLVFHLRYLKERPNRFQHEDDRLNNLKSNIITGSFIGTWVAWISADASSLLNGRVVISLENQKRASLSSSEREFIEKEYQTFVGPGQQYRHSNGTLDSLLALFGVGNGTSTCCSTERTTEVLKHVEAGNAEMLTQCLKAGLEPLVIRNALRDALRQRVENQLLVVRLLVDSKVNLESRCNNGFTSLLEFGICLQNYGEDYCIQLIQLLIEKGSVNVNSANIQGQTILYFAINANMNRLVEWLVNHPKIDLSPNCAHVRALKVLEKLISEGAAFEEHILLLETLKRKMGIVELSQVLGKKDDIKVEVVPSIEVSNDSQSKNLLLWLANQGVAINANTKQTENNVQSITFTAVVKSNIY